MPNHATPYDPPMPIRLKSRITGTVTAIGFPSIGASHPKYAAITTAMNAHRTRMNLPCVVRYVLHVS